MKKLTKNRDKQPGKIPNYRKGKPVIIAAGLLVGVALVWVGLTLSLKADTSTTASFQAEAGTKSGNISTVSDANAAGGSAVRFNEVSTPTNPTKPDASNTGVPAGTSLTVVNGDLNITTAGQVVEGRDVRGFVNISASNMTFRNSIVRGGSPGSGFRGIINVNSGTGVKIENVEINPTTPSVYWDGIKGSGFTATAVNISRVVDGMKVSSNSVIEKSYIHDLSYFANDPSQGGGETHGDGIQILDGSNITVRTSNINPGSGGNAAIQVTQDWGPVSNLLIDGNWMDGGGCTLNIAWKGGGNMTVTANNNRFGHNSGFANCPILIGTKITLNRANNVWDVAPNAGQAVPIQQHD